MASLENAERIAGVGLLGIPTFDFFVWSLDNYARGELLINLRQQLPSWVLNPAFVFLSMCGGLALLYLSHQQQLRRIVSRPSQLVGVQEYRNQEHPGWLLPLLWVALGALIAAPTLAVAYSLTYDGGTAPPLQAHLKPPLICKTADCFPAKTRMDRARPAQLQTCVGSNCVQGPNYGPLTVNPPVNPSKEVVTYDCAGARHTFIASPMNIDMTLPAREAYAFQKMGDLANAHDYQELLKTCNEQITAKRDAEWLTPYAFCSYAEFKLGEIDKAKELLTHYDEKKGTDFDIGACKALSEFLHTHLK